eukprot:scaffold322451_cov30-Prasinocladus_malaysianus.AAC.1
MLAGRHTPGEVEARIQRLTLSFSMLLTTFGLWCGEFRTSKAIAICVAHMHRRAAMCLLAY